MWLLRLLVLAGVVALAVAVGSLRTAQAFNPNEDGEDGICGVAQAPPEDAVCDASAMAPDQGTYEGPGNNNPQPGYHDNGRGGNTYVNDPCLDPPPPTRQRTVQSETEIATFGKYMVAGYNDSFGFYNSNQGLSGVAYSVNGGNTWIDQSGLPPINRAGAPLGTPGQDTYEGDPVIVVDKSPRVFLTGTPAQAAPQAAGEFYYASIYHLPDGTDSLAVNRGHFAVAPPDNVESVSNTSCLNGKRPFGTPDTTNLPTERIVWEKPVVAVPVADPGDFLDKEWLYVSQATGELYLTYTRFGSDGSTPLEMVRSLDGGRTWTPPSVIVPNLIDTFNQATQPAQTSSGRLIVTWNARTFALAGNGPESENRMEYAYSDDDGLTWTPPKIIQYVNPQGEPNGYNRGRRSILNAPYINTYPHGTDVYIAYFNGKTPLQQAPGVIFTGRLAKQADIYVAYSHDNGATFTPVKVNDDDGMTSHVFPTVQVDKHGWVYASWLDRRNDPVANELTDAWANVSRDGGLTWGHDKLQTDVATSWRVRADARPNMGDYNSSELLNDNQFVMIWNDGRFPPPAPAPQAATPDSIFTIANGLGQGQGGSH